MSKIAIIFTGGTIASRSSSKENLSQPSLKGQDILDGVPEIKEKFNTIINNFGNYPSSQMDPKKLLRLYRLIKEYSQREDVRGIVVTHGTDTLEEAACFMDSLYFSQKPVIIVGAMRRHTDINYDGHANLLDAVRVAASPQAMGLGVMVVMGGQIHAARNVTKTHTSNLNAFQSLEVGVLGVVDQERVFFYRPIKRLPIIAQPNRIIAKVGLIKAVTGMNGDIVDFHVENGYQGLVVESMGLGNLPAPMVKSLQAALEAGVIVIICTRCFSGRVGVNYGSAGKLHAMGAVLGGRWSGPKARIRLLLALSAKLNRGAVDALFAQD